MKINPKTEKEIKEMNLWPAGQYGFEVLDQTTLGQSTYSTKDTISKIKPDGSGGNEMIQLVVRVFHPEGHSIVIIDYLLEAMAEKLRSACYACGLGEKYEAGEFCAQDFIGKSGNLWLKISKDKTGEYPDKNTIGNYVLNGPASPEPPPHQTSDLQSNEIDDDEIPF